MSDPSERSSIPELKLPRFEPVPEELLRDKTDAEMIRWMLREQLLQGKKIEFVIGASMETNRHLRRMNGKLIDLEKWRSTEAGPQMERFGEEVSAITRSLADEKRFHEAVEKSFKRIKADERKEIAEKSGILSNVAYVLMILFSAAGAVGAWIVVWSSQLSNKM